MIDSRISSARLRAQGTLWGTQIAAKLMQASIDYCGSKEMGALNLRRGALREGGGIEGREPEGWTIGSLFRFNAKEGDFN